MDQSGGIAPSLSSIPAEPEVDLGAVLDEVDRLPHGKELIRGLNYSHEAMIDAIIANPGIHQNALARMFGYSASWISTVIATDSFQAALAKRREEVCDPILKASLEEQARGLFMRSMEILREKLNGTPEEVPDQLALQTFRDSAKVLGYGARPPEPPPSRETVNEQLVKHADNLVTLLRRERKAAEGETFDVRPQESSSSPPSLTDDRRSSSTEVQPV